MTQNGLTDIFAENLKKELKAKSMNQAQLAKKAETSPQNISKYCKGNALPDLGMALQIADALEVSVDSLLGNEAPLKKKNDMLDVADLLRQLVVIADTFNMRIGFDECKIENNAVDREGERIQCSVMSFMRKWKKYRTLLIAGDIDITDYWTLIDTQLGKDYDKVAKNELLNAELKKLEIAHFVKI